jgi:hypothetical protein
MAVVFDAGMLFALYRPDAAKPIDPETSKPVEYLKERVDCLVTRLEDAGTKIHIPTPALSEVLVRAGSDTNDIVSAINNSTALEIAPFGTRAAIEVALMTRSAIEAGDKKDGADETWNKVKYDRQIIAIARVVRASTLYTDDGNLIKFAKKVNLKIVQSWELPIPDEARQGNLLEALNEE